MRVQENKTSIYDYVSNRDTEELSREIQSGVSPGIVTENGVMTANDDRYQLVIGARGRDSVLGELALWDPTTRDTVLCTPKNGKVLVIQGPILILTELLAERGQGRRVLAAAFEILENAYDEDRFFISNWLIRVATTGAREILEYYGKDAIEPSWTAVYPRREGMIWRFLRERGVNPWPGGRR